MRVRNIGRYAFELMFVILRLILVCFSLFDRKCVAQRQRSYESNLWFLVSSECVNTLNITLNKLLSKLFLTGISITKKFYKK